jgi:hypothetical protein
VLVTQVYWTYDANHRRSPGSFRRKYTTEEVNIQQRPCGGEQDRSMAATVETLPWWLNPRLSQLKTARLNGF